MDVDVRTVQQEALFYDWLRMGPKPLMNREVVQTTTRLTKSNVLPNLAS